MTFQIDARQVSNWAQRMSAAPQRLDQNMVKATNAVLAEAAGIAIENAPHKDGTLRGSIVVKKKASSGNWGGEYGSYGVEYAWQREEGGTIHARNAPYLVFQINGQWVRVKSVTQKGSHFMKKAHQAVWPRAQKAWENAIDRALEAA